MLLAPVNEFNAAGELMYSELLIDELWECIYVHSYLAETSTCITCNYYYIIYSIDVIILG
jgi:hypothetical protein